MSFLYIDTLLSKYNITSYQCAINDVFFYNKLLKIFDIIDFNKIKKRNGGKYKISFSKTDFITIDEYYNDNKLFFAFYSQNIKINKQGENIKNEGTPCVLLVKENNIMHISQIDVFGNYCLTNNNKILNGSQILSLIINFIKTIKNEHNIKYITLIDKSEKYCNKISIPLGDFKILLTGQTWYENYGFNLIKNINIQVNNFVNNDNKKIIEKLTVKNSHIFDIIKEKINHKNIDSTYIDSLNKLYNFLYKNIDNKLSKTLEHYFIIFIQTSPSLIKFCLKASRVAFFEPIILINPCSSK